ncbi:phosphatase PAP2 family protein [Ramlibacter sp. G-1-2-2]|uniref:Phosphatase PAP2 family protein n=1 Tax=Ramlibacter agri TaxID=2728837 RepID=A0A848HH33_9BURK|nr:phosphatase PAP2 family protein [Ramlibacter agri]NML46978.1 phosphatase PAP2 family protein [Ramlibacter agri]
MSLSWPRPRAALISVCLALLLFALFAWQLLAQGPMARVDQAVTLWLAAHRQPGLTTAMALVSDLHQTWVLLLASALLAGWFAWRLHPRWGYTLLVVPSGMLLNDGVKNVFRRARPVLEQPLVHYDSYSFPSGHAAGATVFWGAVLLVVFAHARHRGIRAAAAVITPALVALVCFSRVYLGAHYLSDVLAAVGLSTAWLVAFATAMHRR